MEDKRKTELVCYYCSKELVLPCKEEWEEEEKLKGLVWFCSDYSKETQVNIQINKQKNWEQWKVSLIKSLV